MRGAAGLLGSLLLAGAGPADASDGWVLMWQDMFDGAGIDRSKWGFDVDCWGGGNDERQCYTDSARNAEVKDGVLVITARQERVSGPALPPGMRAGSAKPEAQVERHYSSARLTTRGKAAWRFGRIAVRARLPQGQGTWPAIWMLPEEAHYGPWAASGEIDIMEAVNLGVACAACPGGRESSILATLHFGGRWPDNRQVGTEAPFPAVLDGGFHTYMVEWDAERIIWSVDGKRFAEHRAEQWSTTGSDAKAAPFDRPFHLILNLAIGGRLPEGRGLGGVAADGYPKSMEIDWVKVWQKASAAGDASPGMGR